MVQSSDRHSWILTRKTEGRSLIWHDSIYSDDLSQADDVIKAGVKEGKFDIVYRINDSEGKWHWLHDRSISIRKDGDETYRRIFEFVAARKPHKYLLLEIKLL